jgi:hypothetical protein
LKSRHRIGGTTTFDPAFPLSLELTRTGRPIASTLFSMKSGDSERAIPREAGEQNRPCVHRADVPEPGDQ